MNAALPTGQAGKLLALGLTLAMLAIVWLAAAAPLIDWRRDRAERLEEQMLLQRRMDSLARSVPELQLTAAQTQKGQGATPAGGSLLQGDTDAVAAASLQQLVQDMAARAGANLSSAETLPAAQAGGYRRIGLHISLNASWPVLVGLMQAVEQASPRMLIDDLQLRAMRSVSPTPDPALEAGLTVFAFRAGTAPAAAQRAAP